MDYNYKNWTNYSIFLSAEHTQRLLKKTYEKAKIENADQKSFENCYPFIYYLEHAQTYYNQSANSPLLIQPILLFYGFLHLIKACILTSQPSYPENSSVLAHGVSTRKRKKQQYHFFHDEVKIQKHGLFPFIADKMFHMKHLEGEKASMGDLLKLIPELNNLFSSFDGKSFFVQLTRKDDSLCFSDTIFDYYHMTEDRFMEYYQTKTQSPVLFERSPHNGLSINLNTQLAADPVPLKYNLDEDNFYFPIIKNELIHYPEILIHYLLLYNLSMIARYETEWWSELIKMTPNKDYPFIKNFLNITLTKGPFLILKYLEKQFK